MKKILLISLPFVFVIFSSLHSADMKHSFAFSIGFLSQKNPYTRFSFYDFGNETWYLKTLNPWTNNNIGVGFSFGGLYSMLINDTGIFTTQIQFESTGYSAVILDVGGGLKIRLLDFLSLDIETFLSLSQTGANIENTIDPNEKIGVYIALLGLKTKLSLEMEISKKLFISIYSSYAAYPWFLSKNNGLYVNGFRSSTTIFDSFQIGLELGRYF